MSKEQRKELRELIKKLPDKKIPAAINLIEVILFYEQEYEDLKMGLEIRRTRLMEMLKMLEQEGDMIDADAILSPEYHGQKRPREQVERYVSSYIESLNHHIETLNFLSLFKTLFDSDFIPLIEKPQSLQ